MMMQASIVSDVAAMHGFGRAKRADSHAYIYLKPFWAAADRQASNKVQISRHRWKRRQCLYAVIVSCVCLFSTQQLPACVTIEPAACHHDILLIQKDCAAAMQHRAEDARMTDDCFWCSLCQTIQVMRALYRRYHRGER